MSCSINMGLLRNFLSATALLRKFVVLSVTLVLIIIFPLFIIVLVPSTIFRSIVQLIVRLCRPDLDEIFRGTGVHMALESIQVRPKLSILLTLVFDGEISVIELRENFESRVLSACDKRGNLVYSKFRQRWIQFLGYLFWKWDDKFELSNHIRVYDYNSDNLLLPNPCTEESLRKATGDLIAAPYAGAQSPWEILIVPNYGCNHDGGQRSVLILRIHHAMADGYSVMNMLLLLLDAEQSKTPTPSLSNFKRPCLSRCLLLLLSLPYKIAEVVVDSYDGSNSWHLVGKKLSRKYHTFFSDAIPVQKIKDVKNENQVGYNVVLFSLTLGAIQRLMKEAGQEVPKRFSCFVPLPLPNHPGGLVIHVSGAIFKHTTQPLPVKKNLQQLAQKISNFQGAAPVPLVCSWLLDLTSVMPVWVIRLFYNKMMNTLTMSSFAGPESGKLFCGSATLTDIVLALGHPPGSVGAMASLISYGGMQRIVLTVDKEIFQSSSAPTGFAKHVNDELNQLSMSPQEV